MQLLLWLRLQIQIQNLLRDELATCPSTFAKSLHVPSSATKTDQGGQKGLEEVLGGPSAGCYQRSRKVPFKIGLRVESFKKSK